MKKTLNIMHILDVMWVGGMAKFVVEISREFNKQHYQTTICCLNELGALSEEVKASGMPLILLGKRDGIDWRVFIKLYKLMKEFKIDIVHIHDTMCIFYGGIAARLVRVSAILVTAHGKLYKNASEMRLRDRLSLYLPDLFIGVSQYVADKLVRICKIAPEKISVIRNTVSFDTHLSIMKSPSDIKIDLGIKPSSLVIGTVARLSTEKGIHHLIIAFKDIVQKFDNAILLLIGDGPQGGVLKNLVAKLGLSKKVIFLGSRLDVHQILPSMDIFVLPSLKEGLPLALLEAMTCGLPIVASNIGGIPECVIDGVTGILVPPGETEKLTNAIHRLLSDKSIADYMKRNSKKLVAEQFSHKKMVEEYKEIYTSLIKKNISIKRNFIKPFQALSIVILAAGKSFLTRIIKDIARSPFRIYEEVFRRRIE